MEQSLTGVYKDAPEIILWSDETYMQVYGFVCIPVYILWWLSFRMLPLEQPSARTTSRFLVSAPTKAVLLFLSVAVGPESWFFYPRIMEHMVLIFSAVGFFFLSLRRSVSS